MSRYHFTLALNVLLAATMAGAIASEGKGLPGIDRPIRVGQFKGDGGSAGLSHPNIHQSGVLLNEILTNPHGSNLGDSLIVPTFNPPFTYTSYGVTTGDSVTASNVMKPTVEQVDAFISALDTLDVAIISCMGDFEKVIATEAQRAALVGFARRKGYLAVHSTIDTRGGWPQGDSLHGTAFRGQTQTDRDGTLRTDSAFQAEPAWRYLNRGLFANGLDTTFTEEWFFFTTSGAIIRNQANLKPTVKLVEASLAGGLGGQTAMGDHPHSWYRTFPDSGGRTFYTAVGHRPNLWNTNPTAPRFFRRQLYNAILWLAKYDSIASLTSIPGKAFDARDAGNFQARLIVKSSELLVAVTQDGAHTVELVSLDGRRIAPSTGSETQNALRFTGLRKGVYALTLIAPNGRSSRLVTIP